MFHQLGHRHQQWHLQAAVACLALVPATLQALSAQSLAVSHSAGAVMLELLSRLSVPIMPSSCHAIILCINCLPCMRHQLSLDHASSQIMTLIVKLHARLMFLFLALALIHEGRCRMQITRVQLHRSDLMCMMSHVPDTCWRSIRFDYYYYYYHSLYDTGWLCWVWERLQQQWPSASSMWCRFLVKQKQVCTSCAPSWRAVPCGAWPSPSIRP